MQHMVRNGLTSWDVTRGGGNALQVGGELLIQEIKA